MRGFHTLVAASTFVSTVALAQSAPMPIPEPAPAVTGLCVQIAQDRDTLSEEERRGARAVLIQAFEAEGRPVDASNTACAEVYVVSNVKLGDTVVVSLSGPLGRRDGRVSKLEDLPNLYSQMVRSLIIGAPMTTDSDAVTRNNVTRDQMAPKRVAAEGVKYVRLGYGVITGPGTSRGPAFGFGYRYELDRLAIDGSFANIMMANDGEDDVAISGSWVKLMIHFFMNPIANNSTYIGVGPSWGGSAATNQAGNTYAGSGLQGEFTLGHEMFRASTIRAFIEFSATFPFYKSDLDLGLGGEDRSKWTPSFVVSVGGGYGKPNVVQVVQQ